MSHFNRARPSGEFHLGHQLRLDPGGDDFILYFCGKGRFRSLQLDELAMQLLQRSMAEARANMADVAPAILLTDREGKRSEKRARPSRNPTMTASWRFDVLIFSQSSVRAPDL